ncbi:MAG: translocation/assembly module TamB domain-containing protein [Bacteroidales bacterium]|nr:translocation/assembly module TamB domain-containing protein [Candidatus Cacconaster merdequi]
MKVGKKILLTIVTVIVMIPVLATVIVQFPGIQTNILNRLSGVIGDDTAGRISVERIYFSFPNRVIVKNVCIIQEDGRDTLAHLDKVLAHLKLASLGNGDLRARRISLEKGEFNIRYINDSITNLDLFINTFQQEEQTDTSAFSMNVIADKVTLKDMAFSMHNPFAEQTVESRYAIDWENLDLSDINLDVRHLVFDDSLTFRIGNLSFHESHGLDIDTFKGNVKMNNEGIIIANLLYDDDFSHLAADTLSLLFNDFSDFSDFCSNVSFYGKFAGTQFDFNSLKYYAGLEDISLRLCLDGIVTGPVADLKSSDLKVATPSGRTNMNLKFRITGLPDFESSILGINVKECSTDMKDVAEIVSMVSPGFDKSSISSLAPGETISFRGSFNGIFTDYVSFGKLTTRKMGSADLDLLCKEEGNGIYSVTGHVGTNDFSLGKFLGSNSLGEISCKSSLSASFAKESSSVRIDSLDITKLGLLGYDYSNISVAGLLTNADFKGTVKSKDPNFDMDFSGEITFNQLLREREYDLYKFRMAVNKANLDKIKLDSRRSSISLNVVADLNASERDIFGDLHISSFRASLEDESFDVGNIAMRAYFSEGRYLMRLNSGLAEARYRGTAPVTDFVSALINSTAKSHLTNVAGMNDGRGLGNEYTFELTTADLKPVCRFFVPQLYVSTGTKIDLSMTQDNIIDGNIKSDFITFGDNYITGINSRISGNADSLAFKLKSKMIESGSVKMFNDNLSAVIRDNKASVRFHFLNDSTDANLTEARFFSTVTIPEKDEKGNLRAVLDIHPSKLSVEGNKWEIAPSTIDYHDGRTLIGGFKVSRNGESLTADGAISASMTDTVKVTMDNFNLSILDLLTSSPLNVRGNVSGNGRAFGLLGEDIGMLLDLKGEEIAIDDDFVGDLEVKSRWDDTNRKFNIAVKNTLDGKTPMSILGHIRPNDKSIYADVSFDKFAVGFVEPLLEGIVSDVSGSLSGKVKVSGPLDKFIIKSEDGRINDLNFKLDFTGVPYTVDGPFSITEKNVRFNNMTLTDQYGKKGSVGGSIEYDRFNNIRLNTRINLKEMLGLNTTSADNESFYGKAFATGSVRITGPTDKINIALNVTTEPNTSIHIPMGSSAKSHTSLLTFVGNEVHLNEYDSVRTSKAVKALQQHSELEVDVNVTATPDAEVRLDINPITGDALRARGDGLIAIHIGAGDDFSLKGNYSINEGDFRFNLMGITSKDFILDNGSTITFNGDIMNSDLDLTATYRTKASIETLLSDASSVGNRRTVDCGIGITGKLSNPQIAFDITIPDLDPGTLSRIENTLNTDDKRMRQVLALLVSGSFVPEAQSGIVNNTTILYSNASEIMSNQLNNIFRQLDIPVDLGFNYQPTSTGRDIFDVAISTQLFNNRVTINGNLGNRRYLSSSSSDFVGNVDVEIKLNKSGKLRLNVFSHSADEYTNMLDQAQRNGAGFSYQEEFDTFKELSRKMFWSKARREEEQQREVQERRKEIMRIMQERRQKENEQTVSDTDTTR